MYVPWPCPLADGSVGEESALAFDHARAFRVLVLPALFDEANKTRHQAVEIMRRLDNAGIDSVLPDLAGCNESLSPQNAQTLADWRASAAAAADHFSATHVLAIRAGAWLAPAALHGWLLAPPRPSLVLRALLRARTITAREAGREETAAQLLETGRENGLELAGWSLGGPLLRELEAYDFKPHAAHRVIEQSEIGGGPPWLRAEPGFDADQADALATLVAGGLGTP